MLLKLTDVANENKGKDLRIIVVSIRTIFGRRQANILFLFFPYAIHIRRRNNASLRSTIGVVAPLWH